MSIPSKYIKINVCQESVKLTGENRELFPMGRPSFLGDKIPTIGNDCMGNELIGAEFICFKWANCVVQELSPKWLKCMKNSVTCCVPSGTKS